MSQTPVPSSATPGPVKIEALLAHRQWVRALARSLVRDESSADDVEQQTWQAALENPPAKLDAARAWLGSVVRRKVLESQRRYVRRQRRELVAARPEGLPATGDVVARVEIDRAVVNSVAELPEPYRTTLLLRFYDGLPPRDVARRMGVPVETVRARVRRGLERVRVGLDGRHGGDRDVWTVALGPFLAGPIGGAGLGDTGSDGGGSGAASAPGALSGATLAAAVAALVLGALGGFQLATSSRESGDVSSDGSAMAKSPALLSAETELAAEREELTDLRTRIATLRASATDRAALLVDMRKAPTTAPAVAASGDALSETAPRAPFVPPFRFPEFDAALAGVDWDALGENLARMIPLLGEVYSDIMADRPLRPETVGQMQVSNGALVAIVGPLEESFPSGLANAALTHPAFVATMTAALCQARDLPLSPEQLTAIDRLAQDAADAVTRVVDERTQSEFRLEALIEETAVKAEFSDALREVLTPPQLALLGHEALRGVMGYDLFGPSMMWVQSVEAASFPKGADVARIIASGLTRELRLDPLREDALRGVVSDWFDALPEEYLEQPPNPRDAHPIDQIMEAARHMLALMRRVEQLDLSAIQRESIRDSKQMLLLRRKP